MKITIDALHLLLLGEISLILLITTIYFFARNRKHKRLYQKALKELSDIKSQGSGVEGQQEIETKTERESLHETLPETPVEQPAVMETVEVPQSPVAAEETVDESSLVGKVNKLQRIINFQKGKIIDLMCYKDILEGSQKKLSSVQSGYQELKDRFTKLFGDPPENKGVADAMEVFETNNKELSSYMEILGKENESLAEKFRLWEDELKQIWEEAEKSEIIDEGRYGEIVHEKEELAAKLKEFEDKLQEKTKVFEDMQKQYEDLEKEYMILYRQQQQQQQQQQQG
jgi:chromosome segregation ATPase